MPIITIKKEYFYKLLGKKLTDKEFEDICFDYGLEVEEDNEDSENNYKVELPANRYDLLSVEGLASSLSYYLKLKKPINYKVLPPQHTLTVEESVKGVRKYCVSGIIRNVTFCEDSYKSFIDFQDKLHHNLGRKRTLVSIGTHDMDKTSPPYFYRAKKREDFAFVPLNQSKKMNGKEMMEFYENDLNLKPYLKIISNSDLIPLIMDSKDNILSMPPIINSELSKIDLNTKNIFIDITATDKTKALIALNVLCASFSIYSSTPYSFEQIEVIDGEEKFKCPLSPLNQDFKVSKKYLEKIIGMKLSVSEISENLLKMGLVSEQNKEVEDLLNIQIPFYRTDILHQCDVAEDLAIGVGYNTIPTLEPDVLCLGKQQKLNELSELMREEMAFAGFLEVLNFSLCSWADITTKLNKKVEERAVEIDNPKTQDFQVGRTSLLPGMIKSLAHNKHNKIPFKIFELGDVILLDVDKANKDKNEFIGSFNKRKLAAIYMNSSSSGLDIIHGVLDMIFLKMFKGEKSYELKESNQPYLLYQLQSQIYLNNECVGEMGILNPDILTPLGLFYPGAYLEVDFEKICKQIQLILF